MSSSWRRFEVLLPLRFNDGRALPDEWLVRTRRKGKVRLAKCPCKTEAIAEEVQDDLTTARSLFGGPVVVHRKAHAGTFRMKRKCDGSN
jgi:hypothetical protein